MPSIEFDFKKGVRGERPTAGEALLRRARRVVHGTGALRQANRLKGHGRLGRQINSIKPRHESDF